MIRDLDDRNDSGCYFQEVDHLTPFKQCQYMPPKYEMHPFRLTDSKHDKTESGNVAIWRFKQPQFAVYILYSKNL